MKKFLFLQITFNLLYSEFKNNLRFTVKNRKVMNDESYKFQSSFYCGCFLCRTITISGCAVTLIKAGVPMSPVHPSSRITALD